MEIPSGQVHVLFGPNASGKTSLIHSLMGFSDYRIFEGEIWLDGANVTHLPIDARAKLGLGIAFEKPASIRGVKLGDLVANLGTRVAAEAQATQVLATKLKFSPEFLRRDVNVGFSGCELKRSEILQVLVQRPRLLLLDEPDSGVDVENLEILGSLIDSYLRDRSALLVTHLGYVLRYVEAHRAHVMLDGRIVCNGDPTKILHQILKQGYGWCESCPRLEAAR